jgi:hypothetical protein
MMASHRPADPPPPPPTESPNPERTPTTTPTGLTTLPQSNFLIGFDWVLAFGVLALAFLIASFSVRNSDFWMHLAAGRLMAEGQYEFGKDPFSYTGADRTWVNHAWLFDWLLYQMFKAGGGAGVVITKAIAIAVAAGLMLLTRKPGQSVFPGVVCVALALLAVAPRLWLQPTLATLLFLSILLFLLIRIPRRAGAWLFPGLVAGLFWVWANFDQWFILGPLALLLYTIGQYVRADEGEYIPTLWKALGIGVLATLLTPHHVRAWIPPAELVDGRLAADFAKDADFAGLFRGALSPGGLDFAGDRTNPVNLYSLLVLVALTLVAFVVNRRQASAGFVLVWAGALALALVHLRATPFLAIISAPMAAANLATAGRRLAEAPLPDGTVRTLHALRGGGRAAVGLVGLILIALTYPGWLHPLNEQRRWKWELEPNQSLARAAEKIHLWRNAGGVPPEARLLNLQPDFANYVAWYAPGEKCFFDNRLGFHREEAGEYAALRRYLSYTDPRKRRQDPFDLNDFLSRYGITFAVYSPIRTEGRAMLATLWSEEVGSKPEWALWDVQGRAVIFGWTRQRAIPTAAFDRLRLDAVRSAYADVQPLAAPTELHPPPPASTDTWERFLVSPPVSPVDADEAFILHLYGKSLQDRSTFRQQMLGQVQYFVSTRFMTPALSLWALHQASPGQMVPINVPPEARAAATLAVRAARRAVLASPDHPDGYYYLGLAYADAGFAAPSDLQDVVTTASLARARARIPDDPTQFRAGFPVADLGRMLAVTYENAIPRRLDLAQDAQKLTITYLRQDIQDRDAVIATLTDEAREAAVAEVDARRQFLDRLEQGSQARDQALEKNLVEYLNASTSFTSSLDRAAVARRFGLVREAITELRKDHEQFQKQLQDRPDQTFPPAELAGHLAVYAELIELLWYDGKVEESAQILDTVDTPEVLRIMDSPPVRQEYLRVRQRAMAILFRGARAIPSSPYDSDPAGHFRNLRRGLSMIVGNFERAKEVQVEEAQIIKQQLADVRTKYFPAEIPNLKDLPDVTVLQKEMVLRPALGPVLFAQMTQVAKVRQLQTMSAMRAEGQLAIALTYLEWGDMPRAVHHLRRTEDVIGWPEPIRAQRVARDLLHTIERAGPARETGR